MLSYLRVTRIVIVALLVLIGACDKASQDKGVTLHLIGEALPPFQAIPKVTEQFTRETGIRVQIHPFEFETALAKTQLDFTGNTGTYDVVMGIYFNLGKYVENKDILPIQQFLDDPVLRDPAVKLDNFFEPVVEFSTKYRGTLYGLPATAQTMYLWYRKDLLDNPDERSAFAKRYGYPMPALKDEESITWREYRDLAEFFTRKRGERLAGTVLTEDFYGTCLQAKRHPALWYEFSNYLSSFGASVVDEQGRVTVNSVAAKEALAFYIGLKAFSPPGTLQYTWDDALTAFQQGHIALATMWFDATPALYDPASSRVVGKIGYSQIPIHEKVRRPIAQYGGWAFYINADSRHPKEAFRLIQWLNRPDVQLKWAKEGGLPSTLSTFANPEYLAIPYHRAERLALTRAVAWPREPYSESINSKAIDRISRAVSGETTPSAALDGLAEDIRRLLPGKGK